MFETRVRLLLLVVFLAAGVIVARAAQLQLAQRAHWQAAADEVVESRSYLPAPRGQILDRRGRTLARDEPCYDVLVDYAFLTDAPDEKAVAARALAAARRRPDWAGADAERRRALRAEERDALLDRHARTGSTLARVSGRPLADIDAARRDVVAVVERRRASQTDRAFAAARAEWDARPPQPFYERWVAGVERAPTRGDFDKPIHEQTQAHRVLRDVPIEVQNELQKLEGELPGVRLRAGVRRQYPFGLAAAHVLGRLGQAGADDLDRDANKADPLRRYRGSDLVGKGGVEQLAEATLRGARGVVTTRADQVRGAEPPVSGGDVTLTLDVDLQRAAEAAFERVKFLNEHKETEVIPMHGGAVVLDVATGGVLALASAPGYDPNLYDEQFRALEADALNVPLLNRATQAAIVPGSTVKPLVGLAGLAAGAIGPSDTIECTGYLVVDGRPKQFGRCWTMSMFEQGHHRVPSGAPHATGFLTVADAVQRSCNVVFETIGDRLRVDGLSLWLRRFGLGRATGVGLPEVSGHVPLDVPIAPGDRRSEAWYAGIGQGKLAATPLQMAAAAATVARDGVWVRPTLIASGAPQPTAPDGDERGARVDLKLPPAALRAVKQGMVDVVNTPAGSGREVARPDVLVAAKTGSATASPLTTTLPDGRRERVPYGTRDRPNPDAPWLRASEADGSKGTHSWLIGFAPADRPTVAFAVWVEYGNSGGSGAASVAREILQACVELNYVPARPGSVPGAGAPSELLAE